jgi:Holliday junction resolvase-like predicted endonuclease
MVLEYLVKKAYSPIQRNYRKRLGEIDLIVRDEGTLVLVPKYKAPGLSTCASAPF